MQLGFDLQNHLHICTNDAARVVFGEAVEVLK